MAHETKFKKLASWQSVNAMQWLSEASWQTINGFLIWRLR